MPLYTMMSSLVFLFALSFSCWTAGSSVEENEKWGYVNVREDAYMFWWLYYTDEDFSARPLLIWIQGGPGISGTGLGNFLEIGPLDVHLNPRNSSWLKRANLLFLDNPVGTGFSYVTNKSALARNNAQISKDLLTAFYSILEKVPKLQESPLYIFSESYGGKMVVDFALALTTAIKTKNITCNFKGIALGDSWISPLDHVCSWGDYLYTLSRLDKTELATVKAFARQIKRTLEKKQYRQATDQYAEMQVILNRYTNNADWFNILKNEGPYDNRLNEDLCQRNTMDLEINGTLHNLMNGPIRRRLRDIPNNVTWLHRSTDVFEALSEDFMRSVVASVDKLLINEGQIDIYVYSGQLDVIVNTLGTLKWIDKLKWPGLQGFQSAKKIPIVFSGNRTGGFLKSFKQLNFFWILKAGHYVPYDAPETSFQMLDMILSKK